MTTWNYRACVQRTEHGPIYTVREVYYGPGDALSWTAEPCHPQGDTWMDLLEELILMQRGAMDRRVLDITETPGVWVDHKGKPLAAAPGHSGRGRHDRRACGCEGIHQSFMDDGVAYCGWDGHEGCGEAWPCSYVRDTSPV